MEKFSISLFQTAYYDIMDKIRGISNIKQLEVEKE
jgi:hypothetical protein